MTRRNQSLFDASFRDDVLEIDRSLEQMIWRVVSRYAELAGAPLAVSADVAYGIFDGLFQQALLRPAVDENGDAGLRLQGGAERVLESLILSR
jgi:hypothetical protein